MNRTIYISAAFAFFIATNSFSQEHFLLNDSASSITTNAINIGEVIISSLRFDRQLKDLPAPMSVVGAYEAQRQSAFTISNILDKQAGISMGGDGIWATNINIRGMGEGRLVTLIDGNRVETATDLTAALSMIDVWDISRVEVIKELNLPYTGQVPWEVLSTLLREKVSLERKLTCQEMWAQVLPQQINYSQGTLNSMPVQNYGMQGLVAPIRMLGT